MTQRRGCWLTASGRLGCGRQAVLAPFWGRGGCDKDSAWRIGEATMGRQSIKAAAIWSGHRLRLAGVVRASEWLLCSFKMLLR